MTGEVPTGESRLGKAGWISSALRWSYRKLPMPIAIRLYLFKRRFCK